MTVETGPALGPGYASPVPSGRRRREPPRSTAGGPRVALVHDWLTGMRGGEKVLEVLCELCPQADLFTLVWVPGSVSPTIERLGPRATWLNRLPGIRRYYRHCLPLFPFAVEQIDLDGYDLVVSSSHCAVKSVVAPGRARHLCYCHTPMRYVWDQFEAYWGVERVGRLRNRLLRPVMAGLARWDAGTSHRVDRFVANSHHVARRIHRYYNRRASVVYPPVDTAFYHPDGRQPEGYALIVSALVPYKRIDLAIDACRAVGLPLKVVGTGPELACLQARAGETADFLGACSDETIREAYRGANVVLLPGEEDFGIVPVEAQACGRPVVALGRGGALETVVDGQTGVLVPEPTVAAMTDGLRRAQAMKADPGAIRAHALAFARERFAAEMRSCLDDILNASADASRW